MPKPLIIAHRGASAYAPENTLAAFKKAIDLGADGIELDVHLSKDGEVVVIHDRTIDRTSNGKGQVAEMSLKELKALDFGSWFSDEYQKESIPLLREVLELLKDWNGLLNIELKQNGLERYPLAAALGEKAGLPQIRLHDLRYIHATLFTDPVKNKFQDFQNPGILDAGAGGRTRTGTVLFRPQDFKSYIYLYR
jgi:hypothetical protein